MKNENLAPLLTLDAVAKYLNVTPLTVYRMVKKGAIPGLKLGSDWRFSPEDIATYLAKQKRRYGPYSSPKNHFFRPEALDTPPVQL